MSLPPLMINRCFAIAAFWLAYKTCVATWNIIFSFQGALFCMLLAVVATSLIRYKARPLCQRATFIRHMKPLSDELKNNCVQDLGKIGNNVGLEEIWGNAVLKGNKTEGVTILLSGVTGYVGRAVLFQLLRQISLQTNDSAGSKIILLVRPDKHGSAADRVDRLRQEEIFAGIDVTLWDSVLEIAETSSLSQPNLGCSNATFQRLQSANITHIIHCAADVCFTRPLDKLAPSNITSALQMQTLARDCHQSCERMVFVSTAFVNPSTGTAETPLPEALPDLKGFDALELYHSMLGDQVLALRAKKTLGFQNNYVFSKCVAEHLLSRDEATPLCVTRPGIVGPAFVLPRPGWNGSGPSTVTAYTLMWLSRLLRVLRSSSQPFAAIPVDVVAVGVINAMFLPVDSVSGKHKAQVDSSNPCATFKNLVWSSKSARKFTATDELTRTVTSFGVLTERLTTTEAAFTYALLDLCNAYPAWSKVLHEVFNKGPLQILRVLQDVSNRLGIPIAPGFPAKKLLKFVDLGALYDPYTGDAYYFDSALHIPESFDVDRYILDQLLEVETFLDAHSGTESTQREASAFSRQLHLAPTGRSDLWWSLTQPNGNLAVRLLCFFASKAIRAVYGTVSIDIESAAAALDSISHLEGSSLQENRLVLAPNSCSWMDSILIMYITFAFPSLGIAIPLIYPGKRIEGGLFPLLFQWANVFWLTPSPSSSENITTEPNVTLAVFFQDMRGQPRSGILKRLQTSHEKSRQTLLPICLDYDSIIEDHMTASVDEYRQADTIDGYAFFAYLCRAVLSDKKSKKLGDVRVSFGKPCLLSSTSNADDACLHVRNEQRSLLRVTKNQLAVAEKHFGIPQDNLLKAIKQLGVSVLPGYKESHQLTSTGNQRSHMRWMHLFSTYVHRTHPHWALWASQDQNIPDKNILSSEVDSVVQALCKTFDMTDSLVKRTDKKLIAKGVTAMSVSQLLREDTIPVGLKDDQLMIAAASFIINERRRNAGKTVTSTRAVLPVFGDTIAAKSKRLQYLPGTTASVEEVMAKVLKVDLSLSDPPTYSPKVLSSTLSRLQEMLLSTGLKLDQINTTSNYIVVWPENEHQCVKLTQLAKTNNISLRNRNGNSCPQMKHDPQPTVMIKTCRMKKVFWVNKEAGMVHVEAGINGKELADELAKHGMTPVLRGFGSQERSLTDHIARSGARTEQHGTNSLHHTIKGIRIVTSNGTLATGACEDIIEQPGRLERFDGGLTGVFIGSEGKLGIITSVVLSIRPSVEVVSEAVSVVLPDIWSGMAFLREITRLSCTISSVTLTDSAQHTFTFNMVKSRQEDGVLNTVAKALNNAYVFKWNCIDPKHMSVCTFLLECAATEVANQRKLLAPIITRYGGVTSSETAIWSINHTFVGKLQGLDNRGIFVESIEAFVPWSRCNELCQTLKQDVLAFHRHQSLPGDPFISNRITQPQDDGAFVVFDIAICMQGVQDAPRLFAAIIDSARATCLRHGMKAPVINTFVEFMKKNLDPHNVFVGDGLDSSSKCYEERLPLVFTGDTPSNNTGGPAPTPPQNMAIIKNKTEERSFVGCDAFDCAVKHIREFGTSLTLTTTEKLELYAWYKCATEGPCPRNQRPGITKPTARKKYDAWFSVGSQVTKNESMANYVGVVERLSGTTIVGVSSVKEDSTGGEMDTKEPDVPVPGSPKPVEIPTEKDQSDSRYRSSGAVASYPIMPPRWQVFPVLAFLAYLISYCSLWPFATIFYVTTWTASPFADWKIMFRLLLRSLSAPYGNLPLRFNLVGVALLAWLTFVRFPVETVLWYLDELLFPDYSGTKIVEPLFLLGQPRSGTTKFQDVLAADKDNFCSMNLYEMRFPYLTVQYIVDFMSKIDSLFLGGQGQLIVERSGLLHVLPEEGERKFMRRLRYDLPDEDDTLFLFHGLCHFALAGMFPSENTVRSLYQFSELPQDTRHRYMTFHQKAVQKVMYRRGRGRRYLAKWVAGWNGLLEEAETVYPDAKYVFIARSPKEQIHSWMKLQGLLAEQMSGVNFMKSQPSVRQAVIDISAHWYKAQVKFCKARVAYESKMIGVRFDDFCQDINKQVTRVYDFLGDRIVPGSSFDTSLQYVHSEQGQHKRTIIQTDEHFVSDATISRNFPDLWKEIGVLESSAAGISDISREAQHNLTFGDEARHPKHLTQDTNAVSSASLIIAWKEQVHRTAVTNTFRWPTLVQNSSHDLSIANDVPLVTEQQHRNE